MDKFINFFFQKPDHLDTVFCAQDNHILVLNPVIFMNYRKKIFHKL